MLIMLLIITRILQYSNDHRKHVNNNDYMVKLFIKEYPKNCWYAVMGVVFQLEACQQYPLASELMIFGKRTQSNANSNDRSIFIDVSDIVVYENTKSKIYQSINRAQQILFALRVDVFSGISKTIPEPLSGLFLSLNFGGTSHLSTETKEEINKIGIQHLVAASGMQVSMLMAIASHLFKSLSKLSKLIITAVLIIVYLHLALLSVSIIRASIMGIFYLTANAIYKTTSRLLLLFQVAIGILLVYPDLFFEISFQLSFLATFGILFTQNCFGTSNSWVTQLETGTLTTYTNHPPTKNSIGWRAIKSYIQETVYVSLIVNLWLWPILLYHFSEINLLGLISGLALIWLLTPIFIFGLILVAILFLLSRFNTPDFLLAVIASPSYWLMKIFLTIFNRLSTLDAMTIKVDYLSPLLIGGWYLSLLVFFSILRVFKNRQYEKILIDI